MLRNNNIAVTSWTLCLPLFALAPWAIRSKEASSSETGQLERRHPPTCQYLDPRKVGRSRLDCHATGSPLQDPAESFNDMGGFVADVHQEKGRHRRCDCGRHRCAWSARAKRCRRGAGRCGRIRVGLPVGCCGCRGDRGGRTVQKHHHVSLRPSTNSRKARARQQWGVGGGGK